jgi:hypothetical protein
LIARALYSTDHENEMKTGMAGLILFDFFCIFVALTGCYLDKKGKGYLVAKVEDPEADQN